MVPMKVLAAAISQVLGSPLHPTHASISGGAWTPAQLFLASEQGAWYDPSDFSTMFQDSAGSTPVTAVEQPVGKMLDKSGRGNHATQATAASRPVLSARKNWIPHTEDLTHSDWIKTHLGVSMNGAVATLTPTTDNDVHKTTNNMYARVGSQTISVEVKPNGYTKFAIKESGTTGQYASFNLSGAGSIIATNGASASIVQLVDGYYRVSLSVSTAGPVGREFIICAPGYVGGDPNNSYFTGDGVSGVLLRYPQSEYGPTPTAYQRVTTATDYDTVGFPHFIRFDGVDDKLTTTFPNLGSNATIARSVPGVGASILTGQTIGAGAWDDSTNHFGLVIVNRALTGPETAGLTAYLNELAGV